VARLQDATIAIVNKVVLSGADIARLPKLQMVAISATGTDNVDLAACRERGIVVANIRDYSIVSVPEHCFALMLAVRRNLRAYAADVDAGRWEQSTRFCLLDHPIGDLSGSRLGIVGYGALGRRVAQIGRAFGMEIAVSSRSPVADTDVIAAAAGCIAGHFGRGEPAPAADRPDPQHDRRARTGNDETQRHPDQHGARRPGRRSGAGHGAERRDHRRRRLRRAEQGAAAARQSAAAAALAELRADAACGLGQ
jgi:hypothetical protein